MEFLVGRKALTDVTILVSKFATFEEKAAHGKETHVQEKTDFSYQRAA